MDVGSAASAAVSAMKGAKEVAESANKIALILGGVSPFWGLKKMAVDVLVEDIKKSNLSAEAKAIALMNVKKRFRELKNQMAIADAAQNAAKVDTDFSTNSKVDDEWLSRFMDAGRHVSDEEMQLLWGNILAGEFESPGNTPPSVIRILSELTPKYAAAFSNLCSLMVNLLLSNEAGKIQKIGCALIVVSSGTIKKALAKLGLSHQTITELQAIGLIRYNSKANLVLKYPKDKYPIIHLTYGLNAITVIDYKNNNFPAGAVELTDAGKCIAHVVNKIIVKDYFQALVSYLKNKPEIKICDTPMISVKQIEDSQYSYSYVNQ